MSTITTTETATSINGCACGCGRGIGRRSTFAPGHDARMVSQIVHIVVNGGTADAPALAAEPSLNGGDGYANLDIQERINLASDAIDREFGKALAVKFNNAVHNAWANYDKPKRGAAKASTTKASTAKAPAAIATKRLSAAVTIGQVKVGRWTYDAKRHDDGTVVYTKRDGSEVQADSKVALTFA